MKSGKEASVKPADDFSKYMRKDDQATPSSMPMPISKKSRKQVGKHDRILVSMRLTRMQWESLHGFAKSQGASLQDLLIAGVTRLFEEKGLRFGEQGLQKL